MKRFYMKYLFCCFGLYCLIVFDACAQQSVTANKACPSATTVAKRENLSTDQQPEVFIYKKIDTTTLSLNIYYPAELRKNKTYPAIIFFFGGGWINGKITQFERHAKYFASRGMIAVLADYRVSSRHSSTPFEAVKDAKSAIRYLRTNSQSLHIDTNRIVAAGGSAGGHLAAAADLTSLDEPYEDLSISSRPDALVLFNPVFDNGPTGYGYERIGEKYPEISPLHNIKKGAAPAIVFFGTRDKYVPIETVELYKKKMKEAGSRIELFLYQDQPHGFFNSKKYFIETVKQADIFLISLGYLEGEADINFLGSILK